MLKTIESLLRCKSAYIAAQKRLFCNAKQPLLPCKTMGIVMRWKRDSYTIDSLV